MPKWSGSRSEVGRLSGPPLLVLTSLLEGPKHGYALMKDIESFSGRRLGAGTLYGAIGRLVEQHLIVGLAENDRRRPYEITEAGKALLAEVLSDLGRVVDEGRARLGVLSLVTSGNL